MKSLAVGLRDAILAKYPAAVEVIGKRSRHSKTWRLPNALDGRPRYALDVCIAPVHHLDAQSRWQEIGSSGRAPRWDPDFLLGRQSIPVMAGGDTVTDQVAEDLGDVSENESTGTVTDADTLTARDGFVAALRDWPAFRWHSPTGSWPPNGVEITVAYMEAYFYSGASDDPHCHIYAEDAATPPALTTDANDVSDRTPTTAKVDWNATGVGTGFVQTPSLVSVIQELVNSYTIGAVLFIWKSGLIDTTHAFKGYWVQAYNYDDHSRAAKLHIEYLLAGELFPSSISSAEAFGSSQVNLAIAPSSIASAEAFGLPAFPHIFVTSISSAEAFGTAYLYHIKAAGIVSAEAFGASNVWHRYRCVAWQDDGEYFIQHIWSETLPEGFCEDDHEFTQYWNNFDWHECGLEERPYPGDGLGDPHDFYIAIHDYHLFPVVTIPTGSIVGSAKMRMKRYGGVGDGPELFIEGEDADDAQQIGSAADYESRARTSARVIWTPTEGAEWYETDNIASIINQIVRRPGWASGQAIHLFFEPNVVIADEPPVFNMWFWVAARNLDPPPDLREDRPQLYIRLAEGVLPIGLASAEAFGTPSVSTLLTPSSIASAEAFGTPTIAVHTHPSSIASAEVLGSLVVAGPVTATGIATVEAFGTSQLNLQLTAVAISSTEAFGASRLNLAIAGAGNIASVEAFGSPTIAKHTHPSGIVSTEAFGVIVLTGPITCLAIVSVESFGTLALGHILYTSGIASGEGHGTPAIAGPVTVSGIATAEAFGTVQVNLVAAAGGIASTEAFGTATLTTGAIAVSPDAIGSAEVFGSPVINQAGAGQNIVGIGIASVETFGTALLTGPISTAGIASTEAFGTAVLSPGTVTIQPSGIASTEAFGTATLGHVVSPSGITSTEAFGTLSLSVGGPQTLTLTGIASLEAFGSLTVVGPIISMSIASAEAFGSPAISLGAYPSGIASAEAFGTAAVSIGSPQSVSPLSVASLEAFGSPIVVGPLIGAGIASAEVFGTAEITVAGIQTLWPNGVVSVEAFGTASVGPSWVPVVIDDGTVALVLVQDGSVSLPGAVNDGTISIKEAEDATI